MICWNSMFWLFDVRKKVILDPAGFTNNSLADNEFIGYYYFRIMNVNKQYVVKIFFSQK